MRLLFEESASNVYKKEDTYRTLEKLMPLAHVTTGNGYYLFTKGLVKV